VLQKHPEPEAIERIEFDRRGMEKMKQRIIVFLLKAQASDETAYPKEITSDREG